MPRPVSGGDPWTADELARSRISGCARSEERSDERSRSRLRVFGWPISALRGCFRRARKPRTAGQRSAARRCPPGEESRSRGALILVAVMHRDRSEAFSAYAESLPPQQRRALLLVLWVNAMLTLALQAVQLALVMRAVRRAARGGHPITTIFDCAVSPSTAAVVGAPKLTRERFSASSINAYLCAPARANRA